VLETGSHGFFDIVTASNTRVGLIELRVWRFDGERYSPLRCAAKRYPPAKVNGESPIDEIDRTGRLSEHPCEIVP
jgi:hypothetical protein